MRAFIRIFMLVNLILFWIIPAFSNTDRGFIFIHLNEKDSFSRTDINFCSTPFISEKRTFSFEVGPNQFVQNIQFMFSSKESDELGTKIIRKNLNKVENLNFTLLSWEEKVELSGEGETLKHYLVSITSQMFLYLVESEKDIPSAEILGLPLETEVSKREDKQNLLIIREETMNLLTFLPLFPSYIQMDNNKAKFIKESPFLPKMFAFLIVLKDEVSPHIAMFPSDLGIESGVRITLTAYPWGTNSFEIYIVPDSIVTSFMKKRYEVWGKIFFIEREHRAFKTLNFIDVNAFTYKDKMDQWGLAFNNLFRGYLGLNGKISSIYKSVLCGETFEKSGKIKGLCQVDEREFFKFEIPACIESSIPFPEEVLLDLDKGLPKIKKGPVPHPNLRTIDTLNEITF